MYTIIKITISSELCKTDAELLAYLFGSTNADGPIDGYDHETRSIVMDVDFEKYSAFCILEDLGVLTVEQI